jgi:uncharacterized membrane protein
MLPMVFSSLTAVFIYLTGKRFLTTRAGVLASLLFTFSGYHLVFAHEARVYSLFALLSVISMFLFLSLRSKRTTGRVILLAVVNTLLIYSHFFGFFLILTQLLIALSIGDFRRTCGRKYLLSLALTFLGYTPYLPMLLFRYQLMSTLGSWVQKPVFSDLYTMVWRYSNLPLTTVFFLLLLGAGTGVYLYRKIRHRRSPGPNTEAIMIWFFVPYLLMFLVSFRQPIFLDRYTVFISTGYYLLVAHSVDLITRSGRVALVFSALAVVLMVIGFTPNVDNKRRIREAVGLVRSAENPATAIVICPSWLEYGFAYHYDRELFRDYGRFRTRMNENRIFPVDSLSQLNKFDLRPYDRIIYFEEWAKWIDKEEMILKRLDSTFLKVGETRIYENFMIHFYVKRAGRE